MHVSAVWSVQINLLILILSEQQLFFVAAALHWNFAYDEIIADPDLITIICITYILLIMTLSNQSCAALANTSSLMLHRPFGQQPLLHFCFTCASNSLQVPE